MTSQRDISNQYLYLLLVEIDSMLPDRTTIKSEHKTEEVNQFLVEWNMIIKYNQCNPDRQVLLLAGTNLPNKTDSAVWCVHMYCQKSKVCHNFNCSFFIYSQETDGRKAPCCFT